MKAQLATLAAMLTLGLPGASTAAKAEAVFVSPPQETTQRTELRGMRANIARQLPRFGHRNVDVRNLSNAQVAQINSLMHSGRSHGDISSLIGGTLRKGFLQRGVDRIFK
ncbi:MAG: hypothetical protein AAFY65_10035 [Pseudomonadota bacterium]